MTAHEENLQVPKKNSSFVLHGIKDVKFEERPIPGDDLKSNEVLVAPKKTGICGSETHYYLEGKIGDFKVEKPMTLGHESSGIIVKVGSEVKTLKEGDRVALEPGESCKQCVSCKEGHYERCPEMIFAATPPYDGTLAGFYVLPSDLCYKLPDSVSLEEGAMMEPLSVAVMAVHKIGNMPHNAIVVVFGAGPVGLLAMTTAKALGAKTVIAIDIQEPRLEFAKRFAADDYYVAEKMKDGVAKMEYSRDQAVKIKKRFAFGERGPTGVDLVIDCSGADVCIQTGLFLAKHGGTFVQVGMGKDNIEVPISTILNKELTIKGSFRYGPGCYDLAIDLVARGLVELKPLITHRYKFEDAKDALEANSKGKGEDGKTLIKAIIDGPV